MQLIDEHPNKNRLKVVLAEQNKTNKWLVLQLGKIETPSPNGGITSISPPSNCFRHC